MRAAKRIALGAACALMLTGCAAQGAQEIAAQGAPGPSWDSLAPTGELVPEYADEFSAAQYEGGYTLLQIGEAQYVLCPRGEQTPTGLPEGAAVIETPIENAYLTATSAMDYFISLDSLNALAFSGTNADGWYLPEARQAQQTGAIA